MRFFLPTDIAFTAQHAQQLVFTGSHEESFQVSILGDYVIRVQHFPDGRSRLARTWMITDQDGKVPREGRQREDLSRFHATDFDLQHVHNVVHLNGAQLNLKIHLSDFRIEWFNKQDQRIHADLPRVAYAYNRGGRDVFHYCERADGEHYYGFGERSGPLSKVGMRMRMLNLDSLGYSSETTDPLYKHCPFYITFNPDLNIAYGLLYDNMSTTTFDMGKEIDAYRGQYRSYQAEDGDIDYYLIYGPSIEQVLERYADLTGYPALMPRWTLGYLGSTMSYTEAPDAQEQLKQFSQLCQKHDIPCDAFHLSSGYTTNEAGERCVFTWNRDRVPDPQAMVDNFHQSGIRLSPNIKPYMLEVHPNYAEVAQRGGFIKQADGDEPQQSTFWSGGLNVMGDGAYIDFTSSAGYDWWKEKALEQLLSYGMDSLWNDNNEYQIWDDAARCDGFGKAIPVGMVRPLQPLLMGHSSYHALLEKYPNQRPFVLSRSGTVGIQRYAQIWSGDNSTSWNDLRFGVSMSLGSSLSGLPNTGNDVGGFFGPKPEPELLLRWIQNHIFHPRFCIHSWNIDQTVTEPWMYPDVLPLIREAIHLRYRLIPYLYSLLFESAHTGHPIIRPLVYHFPLDARCHTESFEFMLGSHLLVATILESDAQSHAVYLPAGDTWCDFHTGAWYDGGQTITVDASLDSIPLFVRSGGVIPMGKLMAHVGAEPDDLREVYVFPGQSAGESTFTLIEDDGVSFDYQNGAYTEVNLSLHTTDHEIILDGRIAKNGFSLPYQQIKCVFPVGEQRQIVGGIDHQLDRQGRQHVTFQFT